MKPSVISSAAANATSGNGAPTASSTSSSNGITIPINHEYGTQHQQHPLYQQQQAYSPQQQQQQHHQQQQQAHPNTSQGFSAGSPSNTRQYPAHFQQGFGFEPDMDDMFPRSRLGRLHDPFSSFATRKRCGNDPNSAATDGFSHYFEDDPDFSFPQFGSLGRRRAGAGANTSSVDPHTGLPTHGDSDFFNRLPSEFRQYIPEGFGQRRSTAPTAQHQPQQQYYQQPHQQQQHYVQPGSTPPKHNGGVGVGIPQSPIKKVCDAAIQTEDPAKVAERSEVDGHHMQLPMQQQQDYLNQHNFRNTVDMGVKSMPEMSQEHGPRSHSAPPQEQLQQQQQQQQHQQQHQPSESSQYSTQTSPPVSNPGHQQPPIYQKVYYAPQQQAHPQQKQKSPPTTPQTPGGTYVRTIPIFVEGRSEPIINSHKEIPNQNGTGTSATASASARHVPQQQHPQQTQQQYYQSQPQQTPHPQQQQHRPTPLNTQQQQQQPEATNASGLPPQTPHTMDSINKIQDIQRDVLDLMSKVENFAGKRRDKEYAYLDEMLTRNLLKLDTIDTNGKDSIRLARKEAIKCIQASINVLEAKAEENARAAEQLVVGEESADSQQTGVNDQQTEVTKKLEAVAVNEEAEPMSEQLIDEQQPVDATQIQEPIPLPPPEGMQIDAEVTNATRAATSPAKELQAVLVLPTVESTESKME